MRAGFEAHSWIPSLDQQEGVRRVVRAMGTDVEKKDLD